jgi:signal transduction histidine kinase
VLHSRLVRISLRRPSGLAIVVLAALVLLPLVAVLQFRWIGQVSDAERERRERTLGHATSALTQDLNLELVRALIGLQADGTSVRNDNWTEYAERTAGWRAATAAPAIVKDVLLADRGPDGLRLRRWSFQTRSFNAADWTPDLESYRTRLLKELDEWRQNPPDQPPPRLFDLFSPDGTTIVAPIAPIPVQNATGRVTEIDPVFGYVFIRLDLEFIRSEFLPALVGKHFRQEAGDEYRIAVVSRQRPDDVIYELNVDDQRKLLAHHDAEVDFFGFNPEQFMLVRQVAESLHNSMPPNPERRRSLFFNFMGRRGPDSGGKPSGNVKVVGNLRAGEDTLRWKLIAQHRAGSLEAAVGRARMRNLGLSVGVLLLLFGAMAALAATARRAERLARQQIEFVAAVSHELRTPVSVIGSAAENLAGGFITDRARVKQYGLQIGTEARRLGETVERVLLYAGIEAGRAVGYRAPIAVSGLIADALAASSAALSDANAKLETDVPSILPPVLADSAALRATLQNLVANAIKYGGAQPWVRITATTATTRHGEEVRIAVSDRGLGIPSADLPHIFEPFYRGAEAQSRQIRGNGLGLSIVKGIVEAHGGRVTVQSSPGAGSTFTIHLSAYHGATAQAPAVVEGISAPARGA